MRKRYAKRRKKMMEKLNIPAAIQLCFIDNLEPDNEGCYPDWSSTSAGKFKFTFKHQTEKVVQKMMKHRGAAIHWFQNGHPMKTLVERHEDMMGVDEKTAVKFCTEWYKSKRQETSAIWKQRKLRNTNTHEFSMSELQEQVEEIVTRKRNMRPPAKTLPNDEYRKLRREGLDLGADWGGKEQIRSTVNASVDNGRRNRKQKISSWSIRKNGRCGRKEKKTPENFTKRNRRRDMENTKSARWELTRCWQKITANQKRDKWDEAWKSKKGKRTTQVKSNRITWNMHWRVRKT